ncbi:MAG: metallophosphoesterase [Clostridia bacterium]|nr:metallophosphoesterase [Clostridia bacterium]
MILETKLQLGATAPFSLVHLSDTHLAHPDGGDLAEIPEKVRLDDPTIPTPAERLARAVQLSREYSSQIVHTGDLTDFVSAANLEHAKRFVSETGCFVAAGNHEFRGYQDHSFEDAAYRSRSEAMVQKAFANNIRMDSKVINGVNLVALDDSYYQIDEAQRAFLKEQVRKGLPIILLVHAPIYEPQLFDTLMYHRDRLGLKVLAEACTYMIGVPEEKMVDYAPNRVLQQRSDAATMETLEWIRREPLFRAVLAGHIHCNCECRLSASLPQYVISKNDLRLVHVC